MSPTYIELLSGFARHETFHPRIGWLTKAVDAVSANPQVFASEAAPVTLGVGKNMVRAIRYWGLAMKVITEDHRERTGRTAPLGPTRLGRLLLGSDGWDRYLEDPHSLWLLHWMLLRPPVRAPVWWWTFSEFAATEFTAAELESFCVDRAAGFPGGPPAPKSVAKDVECLLRMYGRRGADGGAEWLDSPFAALRLVEPVTGMAGRWRFASPVAEPPDARLLAYACIDAMLAWEPSARTVSTGRLTSAPDGPGRVLRLSEAELVDGLRLIADTEARIRVVAPAGFTQLVIEGDPGTVALRLLEDLYGSARRGRDVPDTPSALAELADAA